MTVLPFQLSRAFATSRCSPNGTAKMIVSASSASRSDLATTVGPIARACGANASGGRRARDGHVDVFTGEGVGEGLAYLAESYNCVAHIFSVGLPKPTALRIIEWSAVGRVGQICARPPSTASSLAVMKLLSCDARKAAAAPISAGSAMRWSGVIEA